MTSYVFSFSLEMWEQSFYASDLLRGILAIKNMQRWKKSYGKMNPRQQTHSLYAHAGSTRKNLNL